jgi:hypothetical protein
LTRGIGGREREEGECYAERIVQERKRDRFALREAIDGYGFAFYADVGFAEVLEGGDYCDAGAVD